jgi:hypothetical protein
MENLTYEGNKTVSYSDNDRKEHKKFCLELAAKNDFYEKNEGFHRSKTADEILEEAKKFFTFIYE